ncbi:MAG: hypothetical protein R3D34_01845 [Nitratireductor sp.]
MQFAAQIPLIAGGYDTGERDRDFLFQQDGFAKVESEVRYIHPDRRLTNITGVFGPSADVSEASPFTIGGGRAPR